VRVPHIIGKVGGDGHASLSYIIARQHLSHSDALSQRSYHRCALRLNNNATDVASLQQMLPSLVGVARAKQKNPDAQTQKSKLCCEILKRVAGAQQRNGRLVSFVCAVLYLLLESM
jgi:hypothetical protein